MCACGYHYALCIAQSRSDYLPAYPPDKDQSSDVRWGFHIFRSVSFITVSIS